MMNKDEQWETRSLTLNLDLRSDDGSMRSELSIVPSPFVQNGEKCEVEKFKVHCENANKNFLMQIAPQQCAVLSKIPGNLKIHIFDAVCFNLQMGKWQSAAMSCKQAVLPWSVHLQCGMRVSTFKAKGQVETVAAVNEVQRIFINKF